MMGAHNYCQEDSMVSTMHRRFEVHYDIEQTVKEGETKDHVISQNRGEEAKERSNNRENKARDDTAALNKDTRID